MNSTLPFTFAEGVSRFRILLTVDFASEWTSVTQRQYAHLAQVVMKTIYHDLGIQIKHVLVTTDEEDPAWL